jgi:hypothetical protein
MSEENLKKDTNSEDDSLCKSCQEEPVFMNGLCVYCYEDELYGGEEIEDKHKDSKMTIHGQSLKDPRQQEVNRERTISKISKKKK